MNPWNVLKQKIEENGTTKVLLNRVKLLVEKNEVERLNRVASYNWI